MLVCTKTNSLKNLKRDEKDNTTTFKSGKTIIDAWAWLVISTHNHSIDKVYFIVNRLKKQVN